MGVEAARDCLTPARLDSGRGGDRRGDTSPRPPCPSATGRTPASSPRRSISARTVVDDGFHRLAARRHLGPAEQPCAMRGPATRCSSPPTSAGPRRRGRRNCSSATRRRPSPSGAAAATSSPTYLGGHQLSDRFHRPLPRRRLQIRLQLGRALDPRRGLFQDRPAGDCGGARIDAGLEAGAVDNGSSCRRLIRGVPQKVAALAGIARRRGARHPPGAARRGRDGASAGHARRLPAGGRARRDDPGRRLGPGLRRAAVPHHGRP